MSAPDYTEMGCFFSLFMQKKRIFGAERSILSAFQLFLRTIYRLKLLQALRLSLLFGVSYDFPKNYDFSEKKISLKNIGSNYLSMLTICIFKMELTHLIIL